MIEITPQHIADLADDDLRTLVGLLCESELRSLGLPTSGVTFGGHQDAPDGGLDVRVTLPPTTPIEGFVPRPETGFQVKKSKMPRNKISAEMRPRGQIRPVVQELANKSGAYIIVSSASTAAGSVLEERRAAMAQAVSDVRNAKSLIVDFYDQTRLATWVRNHLGLVLWVRQKIGKALRGWQYYGAWAYAPEAVSGEYLLDDKARIRTGRLEDGAGLSTLDGINRIRNLLRDQGKVVRLVGLSGVGKTRFVQALFDDRVGQQPLDPSLAFYTNVTDSPDPQPNDLATQLVAEGARAILVVDNCSAELHRRLADVCRSPAGAVSLITVEYDIREDEPEGTEVFALEPSSVELIEKLIEHRFQAISAVDARTIAEFSGGNARVAISLACTVGKNDTISGLKDEELFGRLFRQRHEHDDALLAAAQACSLVYSFEGEDTSSNAELATLGRLIGKGAEDVFRSLAELRRRDLAQQRGVWRAILPHAIANRLASLALQNIPRATIDAQLIQRAPERLIKSFSRRLGYLHDSKEAAQIIEEWMGSGGLLGEVASLNDLGREMFNNVAPVAPEAALAALERGLNGPPRDIGIPDAKGYAHVLRSVAYDAHLFERSSALLVRLIATEQGGQASDAESVFQSLFYIYLSGTHASIEQRLRVVQVLLKSNDIRQHDLGLMALRAALQTAHFCSTNSFDFGGQSRDYGYHPRTTEEITGWFSSVLRLVEACACSDLAVAPKVREILAVSFRGLWTIARMHDDLDRICRCISIKHHWRDGWLAIRETLTYESNRMPRAASSRLVSLEQILTPKDLIQKVRCIVLSTRGSHLEFSDFHAGVAFNDPARDHQRPEVLAEALGKEVGEDVLAFTELLPELLSCCGRLFPFGRGLAAGTANPQETWKALIGQLAETPEENRNVQVLQGFLNGLKDNAPHVFELFLDDAVESVELAPCFPLLQTAIPINEAGVVRLKRSLAANKAPIQMFRLLAWGRSSDLIPGEDLKELVLRIAAKPGGDDVAFEILFMRLFADNQEKHNHDPEVVKAGQELVSTLAFERSSRRVDDIAGVVSSCLTGKEGADIAREVVRKLRQAISNNVPSADEQRCLLESLLKVQATSVLDTLFAGTAVEREHGVEILEKITRFDNKNPLDVVPEDAVLGWCEHDPEKRYPTIAAVVSFSHQPDGDARHQWTDLALRILERAPDRVAVLSQFVRRFIPTTWTGSRAAIIESNARLLKDLQGYRDPLLVEFIAVEEIRLKQHVEREREYESRRYRADIEGFE